MPDTSGIMHSQSSAFDVINRWQVDKSGQLVYVKCAMTETELKDRKGYAFIRNMLVHEGRFPSLREIAKAVGHKSPRSVQLMFERLREKGLLTDRNGIFSVTSKEAVDVGDRTIDVPLVGSVPCGAPTLAEQEPETMFRLSTKIAKPGHKYFLLKAVGSSMDKSGIQDGDLLLIKQQSWANRGDKVVALVDHSATIKHFYHNGDSVTLMPNSTKKIHKPIILDDDFSIQGVVVRSFHQHATLDKEKKK